jgi:serine/threonine protein kinase
MIQTISKEKFKVKIVDFGFAEKINLEALVSRAGTPGYIAPEIFESKPYSDKGDIFSLGIILYSVDLGE